MYNIGDEILNSPDFGPPKKHSQNVVHGNIRSSDDLKKEI
jgi:hypothetical protein